MQQGTITFKNLKRVAKELGENMTDEELQEMIDEADRDGDGEVNEEVRTLRAHCLCLCLCAAFAGPHTRARAPAGVHPHHAQDRAGALARRGLRLPHTAADAPSAHFPPQF